MTSLLHFEKLHCGHVFMHQGRGGFVFLREYWIEQLMTHPENARSKRSFISTYHPPALQATLFFEFKIPVEVRREAFCVLL